MQLLMDLALGEADIDEIDAAAKDIGRAFLDSDFPGPKAHEHSF